MNNSISAYKISSKLVDGGAHPNLNSIEGVNLFTFLDTLVRGLSSVIIDHEKKSTLKIRSVQSDAASGVMYGVFDCGRFGRHGEIVDVASDRVNYTKLDTDADTLRHFFMICIPPGQRLGLILVQKIGHFGILTHLKKIIDEKFQAALPNSRLHFGPLYDQAVVQRFTANNDAKKIRFKQHMVPADICDYGGSLADATLEISVIAKKGKSLRPFVEYLRGHRPSGLFSTDAIAPETIVLEVVGDGGKIKKVEMNNPTSIRGHYLITEDVELADDNHPSIPFMLRQFSELKTELMQRLYPAPVV